MASLSAKKTFSGRLRKSIQTPHETAQCSRHNYQPFNLTALFRTNSQSLILFETAPAATFLHRRPLHCRSNYHSCTGDHLPVPAYTSSYQFCTSSYQPCTSDLPAAAITSSASAATSPAPATTFLNQRPLSFTSRHQRLPLLNQRPPSCTSRYQQLPVLHQQLPVLNQRSLSRTSRHQQLPVLNQRPSSCTSGNQSCTSDHLSNEYQSCTSYPDLLQRSPSGRPTLFRFTIHHNKVWPFEATPLFCHSCLVRCQSLIF